MAVAGTGGWIPSTAMKLSTTGIQPIGITNNKPRNQVYSLHADEQYAGNLLAGYIALLAGANDVNFDARYPNLHDLATLHQTAPDLTIVIALYRAGVPLHDLVVALESEHA